MKTTILFTILFLLITSVFAQGNALDFDGNDYVDLPASDSFVSDTPFTMSAWIKTSTQQGAYGTEGRIFNTHRVDSGSYSSAAAIYAGGVAGYTQNAIHFLYCTTDGGAHSWLSYETPSPYYHDNEWHHIAATHDGTTARLFYDEVQVASETKSFGTFGTATGKIGSFDGSARFFEGTIEEVRIWNVVLSQTQIDAMNNMELYDDNTTSGVAWSNLKGYWKLNDGSPSTTATDSSDNSGNGTLASSPNDPSWVTSDAPLPVTLSYFTAQFMTDFLQINWATYSETDNSHWNIYRSLTIPFGTVFAIILEIFS
ncbi:MAG: LamG domain-containing protein [Candidatus Cloacimonetes bacterium]|nr:LamG domain-containing protein [Candidatus Cloacimonadota bacterium]